MDTVAQTSKTKSEKYRMNTTMKLIIIDSPSLV